MSIEILTPPGRIVWGHPMQKQIKTDPKTRKPILDKMGKEQDVWSFGLAIPNASFPQVEAAIAQAAYAQFPQGNFPRDFAWKIKRETDLDENNKPYSEREGYAGHTVLSISTQAFCPSVYKFENGKYRQLTENEVKCGDWVVSKLIINSHPGGVYLNPGEIELVGYDQEIQRRGGGDPNATFGGRTYQLPPGVSANPVAPVHNVAMPVQSPNAYAGAGVVTHPAMMPNAPIAAPVQNVGHIPPQPAPAYQPQQPVQPMQNYAPQPAVNYVPQQPAPVAYQPQPAYVPQQPVAGGQLPPPATDFVQNAGQPGVMPGR